jgi:hypothetical protein
MPRAERHASIALIRQPSAPLQEQLQRQLPRQLPFRRPPERNRRATDTAETLVPQRFPAHPADMLSAQNRPFQAGAFMPLRRVCAAV